MKSALALRESFPEAPVGVRPAPRLVAQPTPLRTVCADAPSWHEGPQLSIAIDVVARLAEESSRMAHRGPGELAMSNAFEATFAYMVEYLHHLAIGQHPSCDALARSATTSTELTAREMECLRQFAAKT
jgi:hypothetical protein